MNGNMIYFTMDAAAKIKENEQRQSEYQDEPRIRLPRFSFLKRLTAKPQQEICPPMNQSIVSVE
jgi:hypothetical protein